MVVLFETFTRYAMNLSSCVGIIFIQIRWKNTNKFSYTRFTLPKCRIRNPYSRIICHLVWRMREKISIFGLRAFLIIIKSLCAACFFIFLRYNHNFQYISMDWHHHTFFPRQKPTRFLIFMRYHFTFSVFERTAS